MITLDFKHYNPIKSTTKAHGTYGQIRKNNYNPYGRFSDYKFAGIYSIRNIITNKEYIGAIKQIKLRLGKQFIELELNRHRTKELQKDFNKYGTNSFEILIYEKTDENLLEKEKQYQINKGIDNLYNEKISGYYIKEEYRQQLASSDKTTHKSKEYREKMHKLKAHKIAQFNLNKELIKIWDSCRDIVNELGFTQSVILSCCNGSKKRAYGFYWKYLDQNDNIIIGDARTIK